MTTIPGRPEWAGAPFNLFLTAVLPTFLTERGAIDVPRLCSALGKSHERVYQMLRKGQISAPNAVALHKLATSADNIAALAELGKSAPELDEFYAFLTGLSAQ